MNQFFIESSAIAGDKVIITGTDVNHITNVLRLRNGEDIQVVCPDNGLTYYCTIDNMDKNAVSCLIGDVQSESTELPVKIILYQGLPKGDKLELVIQKAVELGVTRVVPVSMKRSVMKIDPKKMDKKRERWNAIAASAASQSKRGIIPEVDEVIDYKNAIEMARKSDYILLPYELAEGMNETRRIMEELRSEVVDVADGDRRTEISIFIGPEGGFDDAEVDLAKSAGAKVITLGRRILRTETAPLAILSWLTYLLDK